MNLGLDGDQLSNYYPKINEIIRVLDFIVKRKKKRKFNSLRFQVR